MGFSVVAKRLCVAVALLLSAAVVASAAPSQARASTDVMFVFDTTGSMGSAISEAQSEINQAMTQISASIPDVQFGLASMADYGHSTLNYNGQSEEFPYDNEIPSDVPWILRQGITPNQSLVSSELLKLTANGGGDGPEAYGRALYETDVNPAVAWRPGARGVIVLVADNVPHDTELNEGIPSESWVQSPSFNTGVDPGRDNTLGTPDDLDWQAVLKQLTFDGRPLEFVDYHGFPGYLPYWKQWAGSTGGSALSAELGPLGPQIVAAVQAGAAAALPACPAGLVRDSNSHCAPPPPPPAPSNNFKIEPRISCAKGCYVVEVKIVFDSAGNVIAESVLNEEPARSSSAGISAVKKSHKKKPKALIKRLTQAVTPGVNTLKLKLTASAKKTLKKKGSVKLKVNFNYTPTGGAVKSVVHTFNVKAPVKPKKKHSASK